VVVEVLGEALEDVGAREPVILYLLHDPLVHSQVVVVLVECMALDISLSLADEVLVVDILWRYDLLA
jgi:hypothetical protein